jgi:hypothetical protein
MTDFTFSPADFNATEITVVANTIAAKQFLSQRIADGCVSVNLPKSSAPALAEVFETEGLSYS